jgi:hypothetical protein
MKKQVIERGAAKKGQRVTHQRYGAGIIQSLFASYALVEFDMPFSEKTVPLDQLHPALQEAAEKGQ